MTARLRTNPGRAAAPASASWIARFTVRGPEPRGCDGCTRIEAPAAIAARAPRGADAAQELAAGAHADDEHRQRHRTVLDRRQEPTHAPAHEGHRTERVEHDVLDAVPTMPRPGDLQHLQEHTDAQPTDQDTQEPEVGVHLAEAHGRRGSDRTVQAAVEP